MFRVTTSGSRLKVRSGPGPSFAIVGSRANGDLVEVLELRAEWARIGAGQWLNRNYLADAGGGVVRMDEGDVIESSRRPGDPNWRILTGFETNRAVLREAHRQWLRSYVVTQTRSGWRIWIKGMASHLGNDARNRELSEARAAAVRDFLVSECSVPSSRIRLVRGVGEDWSSGSATDNSPRWRAVQVILARNEQELGPEWRRVNLPPADDAARNRGIYLTIRGALQVSVGPTVAARLEDAWTKVNRVRLQGNCNNDLATVEHYLYARYIVATYGLLTYNVLKGMDSFYRLLKVAQQINPYMPEYREGPCPQSPPTLLDWQWTRTGIEDGLDDFLGFTSPSSLDAPETPLEIEQIIRRSVP